MSQDDWFDEDANAFEIPSERKRERRRDRRRRPAPEDWDETGPWDEGHADPFD